MTPERIAELRAIEGAVFSMPEEHNYEDQTDTWHEMLDEIERLQAENATLTEHIGYLRMVANTLLAEAER